MRMVNDRFRARSIHGFELVDARPHSTFATFFAINGIFTANEIIEFSANFRRLYRNSNTCGLSSPDNQERLRHNPQRTRRPGSRDVLSASHGILARAGARAAAQGQDPDGQAAADRRVGRLSAATAAVSDMSQFCKRQPAACEVGGQAATVIGQRAKEGARKIYQIITDKKHAGPYRLDRRRRRGGSRLADPRPATP